MIHQNLQITKKSFSIYGGGLMVKKPLGTNDIYELRTLENIFSFRQCIIHGFLPIQMKEKIQNRWFVEFYKYNEDKRITYMSEINTRYRFNDHFSIFHTLNYANFNNETGFCRKRCHQIFSLAKIKKFCRKQCFLLNILLMKKWRLILLSVIIFRKLLTDNFIR